MATQGKLKKILVADDDNAIMLIIDYILSKEGYKVIKLSTGDVMNKIKSNSPDLILLDICLGGMDGREICNKLKTNPFTKNIPVIIISANLDIEKLALQAGADDFICKPFNINHLLNKVAEYSNNHRIKKETKLSN